eukprot:g2186.t1
MASFVKVTADNSQTDAKRKAREARFKNDSKKLAPPKPKRSFAHPGGKITHNKEAALAAYLKRKKGRLTEDQKAMLANLERLKKVNIEKKEETEVQAVEKKPTSVATGAEASPNEAWDVSIFKSSTTEDVMTRSTTATDDVTKEWKLQDKLGVGSTSKVFKCVSVSNPRTADSGANRHTGNGAPKVKALARTSVIVNQNRKSKVPKASKGVKKPKATTSTSVLVNHNRNIKNPKVSKGTKKPHNIHRWRSRNHVANSHRNGERSAWAVWRRAKNLPQSNHQWKPWRGFKNDRDVF